MGRQPVQRPLLTKSLFLRALECETKLSYAGRGDYADRRVEDPFHVALAEGGYQVGELAKFLLCDDPARECSVVGTLAAEEAIARTTELLAGPDGVIAEAAFRAGDLFVRTDLLARCGRTLELYEVKSASFDGSGPTMAALHRANRARLWGGHLHDVAFQAWVVARSLPGFAVRPRLVFADRSRACTVDGLNQLFKAARRGGRVSVTVRPGLVRAHLGEAILTIQEVEEAVGSIHAGAISSESSGEIPYGEWLALLARSYRNGELLDTPVGAKCASCEFRATADDRARGLRCGFTECWARRTGLSARDIARPTVLDLWNCRNRDALVAAGKIRLRDLEPGDLGARSARELETVGRDGLSTQQRQWLQVRASRQRRATPYLDRAGLRAAMDRWTFPLHFIDFETCRSALPFTRGRRPYEVCAFQFSHHRVRADGGIEHAGQFLSAEPGVFPNLAFVRALRRELERDNGTLLVYGAHENTVLLEILGELDEFPAGEAPDRDGLFAFIGSITRQAGRPRGDRAMIDLLDLVKRHYFDPATGGSNSLKAVLPATLAGSALLREKYARPLYGTAEMPSLNFVRHTWLDERCDPYATLPPIFAEEDDGSDRLDSPIADLDSISEGGAAMIAWSRLQFGDVPARQREAIQRALLRYCELDTLAMVMLWEYWQGGG